MLFVRAYKIFVEGKGLAPLQRDDRNRPEDQVLMRALRDYNIPKIVSDDVPVFMGLIGDLFPALDVPRKRDTDFEKLVKQAALDLKLQPEDSFILKVDCLLLTPSICSQYLEHISYAPFAQCLIIYF